MTGENPGIAASAAGDGAGSSASTSADTSMAGGAPGAVTVIEEQNKAQAPAGDPSGLKGEAAVVPAETLPPAFNPNFKYKSANEEKEIDEFWRPLIKDADSEKKVKAMFSKVDAFDYQKTKREAAEQQLQSLQGDYGQMNQTVQRFNQSVQSNDLSSAFRLAGINKQQVFEWTKQQLMLMDLPPEQRQQMEAAENERSRSMELQDEISQMRQRYEDSAVQARSTRLDVALLRPEVAQFASAWDQNADQPGAFRDFVVSEATKIWHDTKQDLPPEKAVEIVMQKFGRFLNVGNGMAQTGQPVTQPAVQRQAPPVIPNITGKAASPIKKVPKTLDDLKKLARDL